MLEHCGTIARKPWPTSGYSFKLDPAVENMLSLQKLPIPLMIFTVLVLAPQESWASTFVEAFTAGVKSGAEEVEAVERARNAPQNAETDLRRRQAELERARQENYLRQQQIERIEQERRQQQELQNANRERQQLKISIQAALNRVSGFFSEYQRSIDNDSDLGVIRSKVVMYETDSIPLSFLLVEKKATTKEKKAILQFLELRQSYASKALDVARTDLPVSLAEILISSEDGVREIGVALYKGKITYGDANSQLERNFKTKKMEFNAELAKLTAE